MNELVRAALVELRDNGFIHEELRGRMSANEVALALNLAGA